MSRKQLLVAACAIVAVAAVLFAISKRRDAAGRAPAGTVTARGIRFQLDGRPFRFVGANVAVMSPGAPKITGLPHSAVPYFFLEQTYDTTQSQRLLATNGIRCRRVPDYVNALIGFVREHPLL